MKLDQLPTSTGLNRRISSIISRNNETPFATLKRCLESNPAHGGGFKYFYFHPEIWRRFLIWRTYFSDGLVQPPPRLYASFCSPPFGSQITALTLPEVVFLRPRYPRWTGTSTGTSQWTGGGTTGGNLSELTMLDSSSKQLDYTPKIDETDETMMKPVHFSGFLPLFQTKKTVIYCFFLENTSFGTAFPAHILAKQTMSSEFVLLPCPFLTLALAVFSGTWECRCTSSTSWGVTFGNLIRWMTWREHHKGRMFLRFCF